MRGLAAVAAFAIALPLTASAQSTDPDVALERTVRDDDRGVRAVIRYRPEVPFGGQDEIENEDGTVTVIHWDGFTGQFTAEVIEGDLAEDDAEAFLREAVIAVCPSVDRDRLETEWVRAWPPIYSIYSQCPEVDERLD